MNFATRDSVGRATFSELARRGKFMGPVGCAWICTILTTSQDTDLLRKIRAYMGNEWSPSVIWDVLTTGSSYVGRIPRDFSDMFCIRGKDIIISNAWTEKQATIAFLYMRELCGRDVAGIIARKIARMHLADFAWLRTHQSGTISARPLLRKRMVEFGWL
jgi:hypothetical protein